MAPRNPRLQVPPRVPLKRRPAPAHSSDGTLDQDNPSGDEHDAKAPVSPVKKKNKNFDAILSGRISKSQSFMNRLKDAKLEKKMINAVTNTILHPGPESDTEEKEKEKNGFPFLRLPGELRNDIYRLTTLDTKQALLMHLPRRGGLRPRSSNRPNYSEQLGDDPPAEEKKKRRKKDIAKEPMRPFFGLTQVCRQIRTEYRPMHLLSQEVGLDFTHVGIYIDCFYPESTRNALFFSVGAAALQERDRQGTPFVGNITIALSSTLKPEESGPRGTNILPLLDTWANSERIEAGFGRYHETRSRVPYNPETDGEAKDLYRLFGRKVEAGRRCGKMNMSWRHILRNRVLAEIRVIRQPLAGVLITAPALAPAPAPAPGILPPPAHPTAVAAAVAAAPAGVAVPLTPQAPNMVGHFPPVGTITTRPRRPYFQILFKPEHAHAWCTSEDSDPPFGWLKNHGFAGMEHFQVKVGVLNTTRSTAATAAANVLTPSVGRDYRL
ncbi:hypothetical protein K504DRAFT_492466 [Pleomassaria siparia CBS 279.74]|uniref:F-box domain-containing protein n=1 Tax=Pleomassaria siparia CBS 279.74 TaxID=1314801 RepID=A0A6G1K4P4_9PLEO|nr:hypothetical protein K504DRAFT_492466 [Pleomassaria siparia CBS 279.74]